MKPLAPERLTLGDVLRGGRDRLRDAGIESPEIEAELLMRQALRQPALDLPTKAWLLPRLGQTANADTQQRFEALLLRRLHHEPTAYITGVREFCGLDFEVTPDVLIPRPETEQLVAAAEMWASRANRPWSAYPGSGRPGSYLESGRMATVPFTVVDVGTGSGAIAVTLARRLPTATVIATDLSWAALDVAKRNARRNGVERRISFRHGDLLDPVDCYVDFIAANLPYVTNDEWSALEPEVRDNEPRLALTAGADGLALMRSLLHQAPRYLRPGAAICLEFGAGQENGLIALAQELLPGARIDVAPDFGGIPRVLTVAL